MGSLGASVATAATATPAKPSQAPSISTAAAWDVLGGLRDLVLRLGATFSLPVPARAGAPRPPVTTLCVAGMDPNGMCK